MNIENIRVCSFTPITAPQDLKGLLPATAEVEKNVFFSREIVKNILAAKDSRILLIIGPCSIHDRTAALEYAYELKKLHDKYKDSFYIIMRCFFEKPRTQHGWKGLVFDPFLDGSNRINDGLHLARSIMLSIVELGLPVATEFLDMVVPHYISDLVTVGAIGARTVESQIHRQLVSALSMPVGLKNATSGAIQPALDAMVSAAHPHSFIGTDNSGNITVVNSKGNIDTFLILRGGTSGPNYNGESLIETIKSTTHTHMHVPIIIDVSHGNSQKDYKKQVPIMKSVMESIKKYPYQIRGMMVESFLHEGSQPLNTKEELQYGKSITDGCISLSDTKSSLAMCHEIFQNKFHA